jgi:hypothetical protein
LSASEFHSRGNEKRGKRLTVAKWCTDKKENRVFLIYKKIQMGAVAKSYMKKGFQIYEEMQKYLVIYDKAVSHKRLCNRSLLDFLIFKENSILFFISCGLVHRDHWHLYVQKTTNMHKTSSKNQCRVLCADVPLLFFILNLFLFFFLANTRARDPASH